MKYRRPTFYLLAGLLFGELFYVGAFEWVARSGQLERWLNRRPDRMHFTFRTAHSWFPFRVVLEELDLSVQTSRVQWHLSGDEVAGWISPAPLLLRRLRVEAARIDGAEFALRRRLAAIQGPPEPAGKAPGKEPGKGSTTTSTGADASALDLPSIPGFPVSAAEEAPAQSTKPRWNFEFPRVSATQVRTVWLEQLRLTGEMEAQGGFAIRRRKEAEVDHSRLEISAGTLTLAGEELAHELQGEVALSAAPYPYRENRGLKAIPFLDGSANLSGKISTGALLRRYLARAPWIQFDDAETPFTTALEMRRGALVAGSQLRTEKVSRSIRVFGFEARGASQIQFDVRRDESIDRADLVVTFDDFELHRKPGDPAVVAGTGLDFLATTSDLRLGGLPDDARVKIDLGQAHLLDLAGFSNLLPPSAGLALAGGKGEVHGSLEAELGNGRSGSARGSVTARITDATVVSNGVPFTGAMKLDVPITSTDLTGRKFDLSGTRIELTNFQTPGLPKSPDGPDAKPLSAPGWWGRVELSRAELRLMEPTTAAGAFIVHLRDSVPLVRLYATRKDLPKWVERLLEEPDVRATGSYTYRMPELTIESIQSRFEHWGFEAKLELRKDRRRGLLLLEWRKLALGVRMEGAQRTFKLTGAREWFAKEKL